LLLPVPANQQNSVLLEPRDGNNVMTLTARGVRLERNGTTVFRCNNVRINVFITDARVALACSKYDKGGGWIGSPGAMVMLNAASKGLAAIRRHGKMMVGHVRYPWISGVGSTARQGMGSEERLVLDGKADQGTALRLTLVLPKDIDGAGVAAEVARRASRYRLQSEADLAADKRNAFATLTSARPLPPGAKNVIQFHRMPSFYFVNSHSARIAPTGAIPSPTRPVAVPPGRPSPPRPPVPKQVLPAAAPIPTTPPPASSASNTEAPATLTPANVAPSQTKHPSPGERIVIGLEDL
jgi:hypothetical protein